MPFFFSCYVQVHRVDQMPPSLTAKLSPSTVVDVGGSRYGIFITNKHLQASDSDSPTEELQYIISRAPHFGYLENTMTGGLATHSSGSFSADMFLHISSGLTRSLHPGSIHTAGCGPAGRGVCPPYGCGGDG